MEDLKTIKEVVKNILDQDPKTRNSDKWLIIEVLRSMGFNIYINYSQLKEMPSFESITRARRYWQNKKGLFLSDKQIEEERNKRQSEYVGVFG